MNTRLSQDAADSLEAYERQQRWRARVLADHACSKEAVMTGTYVFPPLTAQEQAERTKQIDTGLLPF